MPEEQITVLAPHSRRAALEREVTRRRAISLGVGGLASLYLAACGGKSGPSGGQGASEAASLASDAKVEKGPLLLANWPDYTDPATYKAYTAAVGPAVKVDGFGSNDELMAKLNAGGANYDIVVPSGTFVPPIVEKGLARELDHDLIPNLKNLKQKFREDINDPGNKHSVTKDYGITTFYYRTDVVKDPPDTLLGWWETLPKYKGKNINLVEGGPETIPLTLIALGLDPQSTNEADYQKALDLMLAAKPAVKTINSSYIDRLSQGRIDIGLGWNGDIARGIKAAAERGIEIKMFVSPNGGWFWTDTWLIPSASKNPVAAHKWINYMLEPEVAGREWNFVVYPIPVTGAEKFADPEVANNPNTNIPDEILGTYSQGKLTPETSALLAKYYTRFRGK
jgi:spermidine/putrescine-binding protein